MHGAHLAAPTSHRHFTTATKALAGLANLLKYLPYADEALVSTLEYAIPSS